MARQHNHIGRWASVVCALTINLCAAAPPDDGLTVGGGAGYGQYSYTTGGCGGPEYRNEANDLRAHARAQVHSRKHHVSATLEGTYNQGEVTKLESPSGAAPDEDTDRIGTTKRSYAAALRGGAHWAYGGVEAGPVIFGGNLFSGAERSLSPNIFVSADGWVGVPKYVYAWGSFFTGPLSASWAPISLGLGHTGDIFRARVGMGFTEHNQLMGQLDFKVPIEQPLWFGIMLHSSRETDAGLMVNIEVPLKID